LKFHYPLPRNLKNIPTDTVIVLAHNLMPGWHVVGGVTGATTLNEALQFAVGSNPQLDGCPVLAVRIGGNASERLVARFTAGAYSPPPPQVGLEALPDAPAVME
jgi:hypothetical protein